MRNTGLSLLIVMSLALPALSQESVGPLRYNSLLSGNNTADDNVSRKTTALTLPYFEDFTDYVPYPNSARWVDSHVYINNTMAVDVISRGVATFDALNARGRPYDTTNRFNLITADSLTSQPFDLSTYVPGDSLYLSFFYQPKGLGFSPDLQDSLMLFFRPSNGGWNPVWAVEGSELQPFRQVMIPIRDTSYLKAGFQFRFVNKSTINTNDDHWHVDYIRIAANRTIFDTSVRDLAFTVDPTSTLADYTSMPYRQFLANPGAERAATHSNTIRNHYNTNSTVNYSFSSVETATGTPLGSGSGTVNIPAFGKGLVSFPTYTTTVTPPSTTARIVYRNSYFLASGSPIEPKANDSIVCEQVFDNYLAYDDGTAEKSYFLNLAQSLPGKTAIEFRLHAPDTLRGVAIYFGQQVPSSFNKVFSVVAYAKLAGIGGAPADVKLYEQFDLMPLFTDAVNRFTVYRFDSPVQLPAGVFYLGTTQPASSGSDSLYLGLDANRTGGNHLYVNLYNAAWSSSVVSGALMIRPLLGGHVTGTIVQDVKPWSPDWSLYPNPTSGRLNIQSDVGASAYAISDIQGRTVQSGPCSGNIILTEKLAPGLYMLRINQRGTWSLPQKFIKQ